VPVTLPLVLFFLWSAHPTAASIALGLLIAAAGVGIRAAAAGHLRKNTALVTSGPYALTRNPLYLGSAVMGAGFLVAGRSWPASMLGAGYFALFYLPAIKHEERSLRARYGARFDEYARRVPSFWPRLANLRGTRSRFSWGSYRRNREYRAFLGVLLGLCALWFKLHHA
jgi:protein-S-isoprenylcysteine O-methyltransferase Ste14